MSISKKNAFLYALVGHLDAPLMLILTTIIVVSTFTMYSATNNTVLDLWDQARNISAGMLCLWIFAKIPANVLLRLAPFVYTVGIFLLVMVALFGIVKKGARRWLDLGFTTIQPSEILKIGTPMMLAYYFDKKENGITLKEFLIALLLVLVPFILIAKQPDLGTGILVMSSGLYVLYFMGLSWRIIIPLAVLFITFLGSILVFESHLCAEATSWDPLFHDYQKHRVCTLLNPASDPLGKGFHILQSMIAIGSGGTLGKGWLQGTQTHLEFIPEKHTDFIFAVYSEEFGLIGNLFLLFLYVCLIFRCFMLAYQSTSLGGKLLSSSIGLMFFTYAFVNMGMVSGILPVVGVPLPFMSYGGTAFVTLSMGLGIVMSMANKKSAWRQ